MKTSKITVRGDRTSAAALLNLALGGDLTALGRKIVEKATGHPMRLPASLRPEPRAATSRKPSIRNTPPLVWMVGTSLRLDGAPISQFELAEGLAATNEFNIEAFAPSDGPLVSRYSAAGVRITILPELTCAASVSSWYEDDVGALADLFARRNPDLILTSSIDSFPAIDAARLAGIPSVWNIREGEHWRTRLADRHPLIAARALACFDYPQAVIFVAEASRSTWQKFVRRERQQVIYNAPHPELLVSAQRGRNCVRAGLGIDEDQVMIVSVGTLCARKGQLDLAQAVNMLPPDILQTIRLVFVGRSEGDYGRLVERALSPDVVARTVFVGETTDAISYLAAADVLVNTSRSEAFPRTFIEAAAANTAVVATALDGSLERLSDQHSALFYEAGDHRRLAELVELLARDPPRRARLADALFADLITAWTRGDMVAAYARALKSALEFS